MKQINTIDNLTLLNMYKQAILHYKDYEEILINIKNEIGKLEEELNKRGVYIDFVNDKVKVKENKYGI